MASDAPQTGRTAGALKQEKTAMSSIDNGARFDVNARQLTRKQRESEAILAPLTGRANRAIEALRKPDAALARVPNTVRQSIAEIIEELLARDRP